MLRITQCTRSAVAGAVLLGAALVPAGPAKAALPLTVTTTADVISIDGACSLREAINTAAYNINYVECGPGSKAYTDYIYLQAGATYYLSKLAPAEPDNVAGDLDIADDPVPDDLHIVGDQNDPPTIHGAFAAGSQERIFDIAGGATVQISDLAISGGNGQGGGIRNAGTLSLSNVAVYNNISSTVGGGIWNSGTMTIDRGSDIHHNTAASYGGGIYNIAGRVDIEGGSLVRNNMAAQGSAGIANLGTSQQNDADISLAENSAVQSNSSLGFPGIGGGVYNGAYSSLAMVNSSVSQNFSAARGGGVYNAVLGSTDIKGSSLTLNIAGPANQPSAMGGGIANDGRLLIERSALWSNRTGTAPQSAGGAIHSTGEVELRSSALYNNDAGGYGGAVYSEQTVLVYNSTISDNRGIYALYVVGGYIDILHSTIANNVGGLAYKGNQAYANFGRNIIYGNKTHAYNNCSFAVSSEAGDYNVFGEDCYPVAGDGDTVGKDPKLQPLGSNGGTTKTRALAADSPARDSIPKIDCLLGFVDQRGKARPQGLGCDAGAYEFALGLAAPAPVPAISKVYPASAALGEDAKLVSVSGSNFSDTSEVRWNGAARKTTFIGATWLMVQLTAEDLAKPGKHTLTVYTPAPGGGTSNGAMFMVLANIAAPPEPPLPSDPPVAPAKHMVFAPMAGR